MNPASGGRKPPVQASTGGLRPPLAWPAERPLGLAEGALGQLRDAHGGGNGQALQQARREPFRIGGSRLRRMVQMDEGQVAERIARQGPTAIEHLVVFAAPADEGLVVPADAEVGVALDGERVAFAILANQFRHQLFGGSPRPS